MSKRSIIFISAVMILVLGCGFIAVNIPTQEVWAQQEGLPISDPTGSSTSTSTGLPTDVLGNVPTDPLQIVQNVLNWIMGALASFAVLFIVIGGVRYIISAGNQEMVEAAKKTIRNAIIGLVIAIIALVLVNTVGKALLDGTAGDSGPSTTTPANTPTENSTPQDSTLPTDESSLPQDL